MSTGIKKDNSNGKSFLRQSSNFVISYRYPKYQDQKHIDFFVLIKEGGCVDYHEMK
jgi:hypothetical protein